MSKIRLGGTSRDTQTSTTQRRQKEHITRANSFDAPAGNFLLAFIGGLAVAGACAYFWPMATTQPKVMPGYLALATALLVGGAVRFCGRGSQSVYGMTAATLFLAGCVGGDLFTYAVQQQQVVWYQVGKNFKLTDFFQWEKPRFKGSDLLFYGAALIIAYRLAYKKTA